MAVLFPGAKMATFGRIGLGVLALSLSLSGMVDLSALPGFGGGTAYAQSRIAFAPGSSSKTIRGVIAGREGATYRIRVSAGQRLSVGLRTRNGSTYFNVSPAGGGEALFIGSRDGDIFDGIAPYSGDYVIDVYLMRNAARRGEASQFTLNVEVTGRSANAGMAPPPRQPDYADGMAGGPDFWRVVNVPPGDTLNVRTRPNPQAPIVTQAYNGQKLINNGCQFIGATRWCRVARPDGSEAGWANGRFLRE